MLSRIQKEGHDSPIVVLKAVCDNYLVIFCVAYFFLVFALFGAILVFSVFL
jgi:hypothetical protein